MWAYYGALGSRYDTVDKRITGGAATFRAVAGTRGAFATGVSPFVFGWWCR